jgi:hypothetical protein
MPFLALMIAIVPIPQILHYRSNLGSCSEGITAHWLTGYNLVRAQYQTLRSIVHRYMSSSVARRYNRTALRSGS